MPNSLQLISWLYSLLPTLLPTFTFQHCILFPLNLLNVTPIYLASFHPHLQKNNLMRTSASGFLQPLNCCFSDSASGTASLSYFPLAEVHYRTGLHLSPSCYFLPLSSYIPSCLSEAPLTSWESSRCSFCKVLSGFALQSVHTCLTFFHLSPYILVNFSSQSTTFFPQFRVFFSSSATSSPFPLSKASLFSSLVSFLSLKWTVLYFTFFYLLFSKTSRVHAHHGKLSFP